MAEYNPPVQIDSEPEPMDTSVSNSMRPTFFHDHQEYPPPHTMQMQGLGNEEIPRMIPFTLNPGPAVPSALATGTTIPIPSMSIPPFPEEVKSSSLSTTVKPASIPQFSFPVVSPASSKTPSSSRGESSPVDNSGFSFSDFLCQLEDYSPTLPDSVANHFLQLSGFDSSDPRMSRLISIAAQKYISDIINDAFQHCKLRGQTVVAGKTKDKAKDKKYVLTMEDLAHVLNDYGITTKKPPYYL